jgi:hypothetical protein
MAVMLTITMNRSLAPYEDARGCVGLKPREAQGNDPTSCWGRCAATLPRSPSIGSDEEKKKEEGSDDSGAKECRVVG